MGVVGGRRGAPPGPLGTGSEAGKTNEWEWSGRTNDRGWSGSTHRLPCLHNSSSPTPIGDLGEVMGVGVGSEELGV